MWRKGDRVEYPIKTAMGWTPTRANVFFVDTDCDYVTIEYEHPDWKHKGYNSHRTANFQSELDRRGKALVIDRIRRGK